MAGVDAQRAAVGGQFFHIEEHQAVGRENLLDGRERQVAEVLVVDGVELIALDQPLQVRELHRDDTLRGQQGAQALHEVVDVRHVGQHVVAGDQVGLAVFGGNGAAGGFAEELHRGGHAALDGHLGHVGRRLHTQHRDARSDEVLQQVAVVAGDFHHLVLCTQVEALDGPVGVAPAVLHPARRVGAEVGVLAEDVLGGDELLQLHQEAVFADLGVQREERLHVVELMGCDVRLAQRAQPQVDEGVAQRRAAKAAAGS